jgi:hypothetical protein
MWAARQRGHGAVTPYLERVGVPRSTGYRWDQELRGWAEFGGAELQRLRREHEGLLAKLARPAAEVPKAPGQTPEGERGFVLDAAVLGNSDGEIARLLERAGGRSLSHQTVHATIAAAVARAREVFERHFAGVGTVGAADEVFVGRRPLLLVVEPHSLLVSGLRLAEGRSTEDWRPVFARMPALARCAADGARPLGKAVREAGADLQGDQFHLLRKARAWLAHYAGTYDTKLREAAEAQAAFERAHRSGRKRATYSACRRREQARRAAERIVAEYGRLDDLFQQLVAAFEYTAPDGQLSTAARARGLATEAAPTRPAAAPANATTAA